MNEVAPKGKQESATMKTSLSLLVVASLGMTSLAYANGDCPAQGTCPLGPPATTSAPADGVIQIQDDDDDEEKKFAEVEKLLNEVLLVDETGRIILRKEFRDSLPIPAERVEGMLGAFVELDADGRMKIKDREAIRPYLPMIKGFLGGGLNRLKELQKLPPDERRDAMRRLFGRGQGGGNPFGNQPRKKEAPQTRPKSDRARPGRRRARRPQGEQRPNLRRANPHQAAGSVEERLERIEKSMARIERMLRSQQGRTGPRRQDGARRRGDFLRGLFERLRGGDRDRGFNRQRGNRRGRGFNQDGDRRSMRGFMQRGRAFRQGIRKLFEIMGPEDFDRLRKGLGALTEGGIDPDTLRNPGELLGKLQGKLSPEDTGRFMEIFSEFIGSPEGRAFADEVEQSVAQLEQFVNSEQGQRLAERVEELQKQFGGNQGQLQERLKDLIQPGGGRDRARPEHQPKRERRSARRRHQPENPPAGSKLY